ncbi:hypothetical protein ACGFWD_27360 [Streptomyces sp. NPDC048448]|uniref:hypothetical protein n=1 Tax=Streptomyces sp. NPDC048448 TaxID=3365554 RepID=UPI003713BBA3
MRKVGVRLSEALTEGSGPADGAERFHGTRIGEEVGGEVVVELSEPEQVRMVDFCFGRGEQVDGVPDEEDGVLGAAAAVQCEGTPAVDHAAHAWVVGDGIGTAGEGLHGVLGSVELQLQPAQVAEGEGQFGRVGTGVCLERGDAQTRGLGCGGQVVGAATALHQHLKGSQQVRVVGDGVGLPLAVQDR